MRGTGALCFACVGLLLPAVVVLGAEGWIQTGVAAQRSMNPVAQYAAIVVEKVTVDRNPATKDLPDGLDLILHDRITQELWKKSLFRDVLDAGEPAGDGPRVNLTCTVLLFDPGSRAARVLAGGMGPGQAKIRARLVLRDAQSGAEVLQFERQGTFKGTKGLSLGSLVDGQNQANLHAVDGLAKAAIKELASVFHRVQPAIAWKPELPVPTAVQSEPPGAPTLPSKPTARECAELGRSDGQHVRTAGAFTMGLASGLCCGPLGVGVVYFAQAEPRPSSTLWLTDVDPGCQRAYEAMFADAGKRHKRKAALVGGGLGFIIQSGLIVYFIGDYVGVW